MEMDNRYETPDAELIKEKHLTDPLASFMYLNTGVVIGLSIITFGAYMLFWLFYQTKRLNNLPHTDPINKFFIFSVVILFIFTYAINISKYFIEIQTQLYVLSQVLSLVMSILWFLWVFKFANRLNIYLYYQTSYGQQLQPVLTFFFQTFYLSYKLNQNIKLMERS